MNQNMMSTLDMHVCGGPPAVTRLVIGALVPDNNYEHQIDKKNQFMAHRRSAHTAKPEFNSLTILLKT